MSLHRLRPFRGLLLFVAVLLFSTGAIRGQSGTPVSPTLTSAESDLARWAVTQGGLLVVVFVVIWSYRRDFARALDGERDRADRAYMMMERTTAALVAHSDALRAQTDCVNKLADSVKSCQMVQELLHTRAQE